MMTSPFSRLERSSSQSVGRRRLGSGCYLWPLLATLSLLFGASLFAQESLASVRNETEGLVVFATFSQEEWDNRGSLLWVSDPVGLFERAERPLDFVPSGGVRLLPLQEGSTLAGYLMEPDRSDWTLLRLSASPGEQITLQEESLSQRRLPADQLPSLSGPILLDGRFADWENEPALSAIPNRYEPRRFVRERRGERRTMEIGDSLGWGSGGTRLQEIKAVSASEALYLFVSWRETPMEQTDLLIYFYGEDEIRPLGTIRIDGASDRGALELLRPGGETPRRVGNYIRRENALEGEIRRFSQLEELRFAVISTLFRGERWYEEFPITRIELDKILN